MNFKFKSKPERVSFEPKGHTYTNGKGQKYTSVTTLISEYYKPFDSDYWSTYKACKDVMENARIWSRYKEAAGGWTGVVEYFERNRQNLDQQLQNQINAKKQDYIAKWDYEREHAAALGTKQHNDLESLVLSHKKIDLGKRRIARVSPADLLDLQGFYGEGNGLYPELLLWNDQFRLAGQADIVEKIGKEVHIKDYKTSKKIEFEPFMGTMMLEPVEELPDTNYSKFTLQLSTYGWMLEQIGYRVTGLTVIHINRETGDEIDQYPLAYRKDLVIKMLEDHDSKGIRVAD